MAYLVQEVPDPKEEPGCGSYLLVGMIFLGVALCGGFKSCEDEKPSNTKTVTQEEVVEKEHTDSSMTKQLTPTTVVTPHFETSQSTQQRESKEYGEKVPELTKKEQRKAERAARKEARRNKKVQNKQ